MALLGSLAAAVVAAEVLRFQVIGRALGVRVRFMAALDATAANNFMSWLAPTAFLGEPAAIDMLVRRGVAWDAALLATYVKFATSFVFLLELAALAGEAAPRGPIVDLVAGLGETVAASPALGWVTALDLLTGGEHARAPIRSAGPDGDLDVVALARPTGSPPDASFSDRPPAALWGRLP